MALQIMFFISCALLAPSALAQGATSDQPRHEEQNETMIDTLKRMQIKREESEHKKILEKASQIKEGAESLLKEAAGQDGDRLPRSVEKRLKDIEKFSRQIRSEFGGSQDEPLDTPPSNLTEALKQLGEASERLNENLAKTSRRVISIAVVSDTTDIIQLTKILRNYLN